VKKSFPAPAEPLPEALGRTFLDKRVSGPLPVSNSQQLVTWLIKLLLGLPADILASVISGLCAKAVASGKEETVTEYFDSQLEVQPTAQFLAAIAAEENPTVLFVARRPYFTILREALHLRDLGWKCYLLHSLPVDGDVQRSLDEAFAGRLQMANHQMYIERLVRAAAADIVHVQCWMFDYILGAGIIRATTNVPVVCEFYDVTSLYADEAFLKSNWEASKVDLDLAMERIICREADAVVTRFAPEALVELEARHEHLTETIQFWPYPSHHYINYGTGPASASDGKMRFVFAGGVFPLNNDHPSELFPGRGLLPAAEKLLKQGYAVDVLHDPNRPLSPSDATYRAYFDFADLHPEFRFLNGLPADKVAGALSEYDFGMILFDMPAGVLKTRAGLLDWGIGTKLFTYLEAGLPVIVNREYGYMAKIIEDNDIGIAVSSEEIASVSDRISALDLQSLRKNVRVYNEKFGMSSEINRLAKLYDGLISKN
jgi:glycosyltransferase involved in cell wall biosynthesis